MSNHPNNYFTNKTKPYTVTANDLDVTINYVNTTRAVNKGGTGLVSYTTGDILYASGTTTLAKVSIGDAGTYLTSDGSAPSWDFLDRMSFTAIADVDIEKGEAVYITGISGNNPTVDLARANNASTMPAFGLAAATVTATNSVEIVTFGSLRGLTNTDFREGSLTFAIGDTVYVSSATAGKLTNVAPTGEANLIQNIGRIERATPLTNMTVKVGGSGRTAATPALNDGNIFIGDSNNESSTATLDTSLVPENTNLYYTDARARSSVSASGDLSYDSGTGAFSFTETHLSRAGSYDYLSVNDHEITLAQIDLATDVTGTLDSANIDPSLSITSLEIDSTSVDSILDEDDMASDSVTALATQQSIKAYVDSQVANENELSEMDDVILTNPANGDLLQYGGSNWINSTSFPGQYAFTNSTGTTLEITNGTGFEIDFVGETTTNLRSKRDMHLLAQAGYGINLGSNNTTGVLVVASDGDVDMSGGLNVTGSVSTGAISTSGNIDLNGNTITDFGAIEFYTFTNNTVATSNGIISGTITGNTFTSSSTMITISAGTLQKLKLKSGTIGNVDVTSNSYIPTSYPHNFEFKLQINNGSGWEDYSSTSTYTVSSGTPTFNNLTLNSSVNTYNNSDALGDDINIRIQARSTKAEVGFNTDADYNFDLTTAISYALATREEVYYSFDSI